MVGGASAGFDIAKDGEIMCRARGILTENDGYPQAACNAVARLNSASVQTIFDPLKCVMLTFNLGFKSSVVLYTQAQLFEHSFIYCRG